MMSEPRKPLGEWKPPTDEELDADTDFENEALQREVERDTAQWVNGINTPQEYTIGENAFTLDPSVLKGMMEAEEE